MKALSSLFAIPLVLAAIILKRAVTLKPLITRLAGYAWTPLLLTKVDVFKIRGPRIYDRKAGNGVIMTFSEELKWRGFVNQTTLRQLSALDKGDWVFYHGYDASADSQTIGNLAAMMLDRLFLRHGHRGLLLAGGATSLIGDPGGKDSERTLQSEATIAANVRRLNSQLRRVLKDHDYKLLNNLSWTRPISLLTFLRDIGKNIAVNTLLQRDFIASRLEGSGISYAEFSYTLLQGFDFLHLFDNYGCRLQLCGADQWGNGLTGVELIRKKRSAEAHVLTMPLIINRSTGKKFGKSEAGAVWLDAGKTSISQFYQFWLNLDDKGLDSYLKIYTDITPPELVSLLKRHAADPGQRLGQRYLARSVTQLLHGRAAAERAERLADLISGRRPLKSATAGQLAVLRREQPFAAVPASRGVCHALAASGLAGSISEARRLLEAGGIYICGQPARSDDWPRPARQRLLLRRGKAFKDTALIEFRGR